MPVHESSRYRVIIVCQLVSILVPDSARAMSAWMPLKSEVVFGSKTINDPKNYRLDTLAFKLYLKLLAPARCAKFLAAAVQLSLRLDERRPILRFFLKMKYSKFGVDVINTNGIH